MRITALGLLAPLLVTALSASPVAAVEEFDLTLRLPGEDPTLGQQGLPVLVGGLWHEFTVGLPSPLESSLRIEAGHEGATSPDLSNHYVWVRDEAAGTWVDPLYGIFVDASRSSTEGLEITFTLGVDATATPGIWDVVFVQDGASLGNRRIEVQAPDFGFGLSAADFNFRVQPFEPAILSSEEFGQYLRVLNQGNIPLRLSVVFDKLANRLSLVNPSDVAHLQSDVRYFVRLELDPRPPQIVEVRGVSRVEILHRIPSPGASQLVPAIEGSFNVRVIVGRSGYAVQPVGDLIFQTLESLNAAFGSLVAWNVYLTGDEEVFLNIEVENARLVGVFLGEARLGIPVLLAPPSNSELALTVQIITDLPSTVAEVLFTLHGLESGEIRTFRTTVIVGPKAPAPPLPPSYLWLIAAALTASVLAWVSYNHLRFTAQQRLPASRGTGGRGPPERRKAKEEGPAQAGERKKASKARGKNETRANGGTSERGPNRRKD